MVMIHSQHFSCIIKDVIDNVHCISSTTRYQYNFIENMNTHITTLGDFYENSDTLAVIYISPTCGTRYVVIYVQTTIV